LGAINAIIKSKAISPQIMSRIRRRILMQLVLVAAKLIIFYSVLKAFTGLAIAAFID